MTGSRAARTPAAAGNQRGVQLANRAANQVGNRSADPQDQATASQQRDLQGAQLVSLLANPKAQTSAKGAKLVEFPPIGPRYKLFKTQLMR
jgi:hypothetical protein